VSERLGLRARSPYRLPVPRVRPGRGAVPHWRSASSFIDVADSPATGTERVALGISAALRLEPLRRESPLPKRALRRLRGKDSNLDYLIQSSRQASRRASADLMFPPF
jgi:hypothetical protein